MLTYKYEEMRRFVLELLSAIEQVEQLAVDWQNHKSLHNSFNRTFPLCELHFLCTSGPVDQPGHGLNSSPWGARSLPWQRSRISVPPKMEEVPSSNLGRSTISSPDVPQINRLSLKKIIHQSPDTCSVVQLQSVEIPGLLRQLTF